MYITLSLFVAVNSKQCSAPYYTTTGCHNRKTSLSRLADHYQYKQ